ncbi:MAG: DnaJ domain-containing protein [Candidatus Limnocylindria bacterium]
MASAGADAFLIWGVTTASNRATILDSHPALYSDVDAYRILQVDSRAESFVLAAAYRALVRHYHPDGPHPDTARMAEINGAYALVRTPDERRRYDMERLNAVGPGRVSAPHPIVVEPPSRFDPLARRASQSGTAPSDGSSILTFGRYAGWSLRALARHDPDYLRWLVRHSSGVQYRREILDVLPKEVQPGARLNAAR